MIGMNLDNLGSLPIQCPYTEQSIYNIYIYVYIYNRQTLKNTLRSLKCVAGNAYDAMYSCNVYGNKPIHIHKAIHIIV